MEDMTKHQLVLLVLLVSFVTALVTGIVTVSLMNQVPQPLTQTIQKVVERVVDKSTGVVTEPLKNEEKQDLELSAQARDVLIQDIANRVSPAVVSVIASKDVPVIEQYYVDPLPQDDFFRQFIPELQIPQYRQKGTVKQQVSSGTGFFVAEDGTLITNRHVVEDKDAEYTILTNDGKKIKAKVIARDPLNDMAVLKAEEGSKFPIIQLGDSSAVKIGQTVIAIGNALGEFQNTVSVGVISGLKRNITASGAKSGPEELSEVIQTDAAINPGNSGGPLLNLKGEAIALNTAIAEGAQNVGFSIPINQIKRSLKEAQKLGKISYPYLGVRYIIITPEIKEKYKLNSDYGAYIVDGQGVNEPGVLLNSPASKAGLTKGDIILEFSGIKVTKDNPLNKLIQEKQVGDKISVKYKRDGHENTIEIALEERREY
ncbi:trypsin-like peptidase domain-containing protein [Candidatus Giovannonibacteria bacterium]|nr:trypsin-like peptidase domain-containing protein [Candidatus Giovannonibacteria bacterium]